MRRFLLPVGADDSDRGRLSVAVTAPRCDQMTIRRLADVHAASLSGYQSATAR